MCGVGGQSECAAKEIRLKFLVIAAVDTACSSALVALHSARQSLMEGTASAATAAGAVLTLGLFANVLLEHVCMTEPLAKRDICTGSPFVDLQQ